MMAGVNVSDEQLGGITDRTIQEADLERDGAISFEEFVEALEKVNWQAESEQNGCSALLGLARGSLPCRVPP